MRNIEDYAQKYCKLHFGDKQVLYRRKAISSMLNKYKHKNMLEVGCGMEPIGMYVKDHEFYTIVEPSMYFAEHARENINLGGTYS